MFLKCVWVYFLVQFSLYQCLDLLKETVDTINEIVTPIENPEFTEEQLLLSPLKVLNQIDSDAGLTCGQLIQSRGFSYERHTTTTDDGYNLQLYRIVNPYAREALGKKLKPVLIVHGLLVSCGSWMFADPYGHIQPWINGTPPNVTTNSLAFVLANDVYDVWLGNSRGTSYSKSHVTLDPDTDPAYWDFDFDELAKYDAPAMVDYIIDNTSHDKIVYIGYSQGSMSMLIHLSDNPGLSDKLDLNILLAPIFRFLHAEILNLLPEDLKSLLSNALEYYKHSSFQTSLPKNLPVTNAFLSTLCLNDPIRPICLYVLGEIFGHDSVMLNATRFPVLTSLLDTISLKSAFHYIQFADTGIIHKFNYGETLNQKIYGSKTPPIAINITNIPTNNLVLITALNDPLSVQADIEFVRQQLTGKPLVDHVVEYPYWAHVDYIMGMEAYKYVHSVILDVLRNNL